MLYLLTKFVAKPAVPSRSYCPSLPAWPLGVGQSRAGTYWPTKCFVLSHLLKWHKRSSRVQSLTFAI